MKLLALVILLLATLPTLAQAPEFQTIEDGVEYREVKLDSPRPLLMIQLRCDPRKINLNLLLHTVLHTEHLPFSLA